MPSSPLPTILFFFHVTATPEIYTLSLHDALPISLSRFLRGLPLAGRYARSRRGTPHKLCGCHARRVEACESVRPSNGLLTSAAPGICRKNVCEIGRAHV